MIEAYIAGIATIIAIAIFFLAAIYYTMQRKQSYGEALAGHLRTKE